MELKNYNLIMEHRKEVRKITTPKKIGRPKAKNPKNVDIKVRFDEKTNEKILGYCKRNNITRTEMLRNGVELLLKTEKTN